jgi:hypothetical protein
MLALVALALAASPFEGLQPQASSPPAAVKREARCALETKLDLGGLLGASWYVAPARSQIQAAWENAKGTLLGEGPLDGQTLLLAAPVVGPWMVAQRDGSLDGADRALLVTSGALQLLGLSLGAWRLAQDQAPSVSSADRGPVLSVSPVAGGRLGLSVQLTGL